jgi:hypothetical protein
MANTSVRAAIVMAACVTAGCYNYAPLASVDPAPGTSLAVTLSDAGSETLMRSLGPEAFVVRGRYLGTDERGLLLSVTSVERRRGWVEPWSGETVALPNDVIASTEVRRLAKGRSLLLAGAGVVGVVAVGSMALTGGGTDLGVANGPPGKK